MKRGASGVCCPAATLPLGDGLTEPNHQDIQIAHIAEKAGEPLQLPLDFLPPASFDQAFQCAKLASQPTGRDAQAMNPLAVATPGLGLSGYNPRDPRV